MYAKMEHILNLRKKFKNREGKLYQPQSQKHKLEVSFSCNRDSSQNLIATADFNALLSAINQQTWQDGAESTLKQPALPLLCPSTNAIVQRAGLRWATKDETCLSSPFTGLHTVGMQQNSGNTSELVPPPQPGVQSVPNPAKQPRSCGVWGG